MFSHLSRSLTLIALSHMTIEVCNNFLPVVYPLFIATLGLTYSQIGIIVFVAGASTSLTQPLFGYASDRWFPGLIVVLSIAWSGLMMSLVGFTWDYLSLVVVVAVGALGSAAFHPSGATIASAGDGTRRGAKVSIFSVGGNVGAALSPLLVTAAIAWLGLRGTAVLIPIALVVSLFVYRKMEPASRPKKSAALVRHDTATEWSIVLLFLIVVAMMFRAWFQVSLVTYLPIWVQSEGGSLAAGGRTLFAFLAFTGVGSLIGGALSDRVGRWQVVALCLALLGPAEWLLLSTSGPSQLALLGVMGVLMGATFPVSIVMAQEVWTRGLGIASGLVIGLPWVGSGIGASFTGLVADQHSLILALRLLIVPAALGAINILAYAALRQRQRRSIGTGVYLE